MFGITYKKFDINTSNIFDETVTMCVPNIEIEKSYFDFGKYLMKN